MLVRYLRDLLFKPIRLRLTLAHVLVASTVLLLTLNAIMRGEREPYRDRLPLRHKTTDTEQDPEIVPSTNRPEKTNTDTKRPPGDRQHVPPSPEEEYKRRQQVAFSACMAKHKSDWLSLWPKVKDVPRFSNSPMISSKTKLLYCPVGKVASSFFTRWVLAMNKPGPMTSPYGIAINDAGRKRAESLDNIPRGQKRIDFLNTSKRVVFGRDPYSRIFSAYVDKIYSPNPTYWSYWAKRATKLDHTTSKKCGSDMPFSQFVRTVVERLARTDVHLIPVSEECNVCQMPYDVIGKLEKTLQDLDYASKLINISSSFQHELGYKAAAQRDVILDSINSAFRWKKGIFGCGVTPDEMGKRMWRKLQIRGVIDTSFEYPIKPDDIRNMTASEFIRLCDEAIDKSTDRVRLKNQRSAAIQSAYSTVSKELVQQIQNVYSLDFEYFEYEKDPQFLTKGSDQNVDFDVFQWEKSWRLI